MWNASDYVIQFNFKLTHLSRSINTADALLFRPELKVTEQKLLKISEDIQTTLIEVTTSSSDVADEEQLFSTQTENQSESEVEQTLQRKEQSLQNAIETVADKEPSKSGTSVKQFTKINRNATSYSMIGVKANARIRVNQDVDQF